ncbi:hypothetical protein RRG08_001584 [Elysia crispata]|uniref:Uncharacterized protein n=1 Tax=Elysia crispata TaxID=231223 RepID=A0AAE1E195_9GAST|nr:hypothetical protein RRG08_001584 [Elysia crispata]
MLIRPDTARRLRLQIQAFTCHNRRSSITEMGQIGRGFLHGPSATTAPPCTFVQPQTSSLSSQRHPYCPARDLQFVQPETSSLSSQRPPVCPARDLQFVQQGTSSPVVQPDIHIVQPEIPRLYDQRPPSCPFSNLQVIQPGCPSRELLVVQSETSSFFSQIFPGCPTRDLQVVHLESPTLSSQRPPACPARSFQVVQPETSRLSSQKPPGFPARNLQVVHLESPTLSSQRPPACPARSFQVVQPETSMLSSQKPPFARPFDKSDALSCLTTFYKRITLFQINTSLKCNLRTSRLDKTQDKCLFNKYSLLAPSIRRRILLIICQEYPTSFPTHSVSVRQRQTELVIARSGALSTEWRPSPVLLHRGSQPRLLDTPRVVACWGLITPERGCLLDLSDRVSAAGSALALSFRVSGEP